ncbi:acetylxylan esterase [Arsenicibacter rosenii]|uniref:Acetylxylan esterase n=2 Tax=Arsenicibacter rosenii TaxID=1750698 RepID=A0A1S2V9V2_9BACT|nr:acetylxylan esterase [Arsenicibacter rosenii]
MEKEKVRFGFRVLWAALVFVICLAFMHRQPPRLKLFLLIGQSNMAGRGKVDPQELNPNIWMLTREEQWVTAKDPLHFDKPAVVGVGPGLSFAETLSKQYPDMQIGLVPCAVGGSEIDVWSPGAYYAQTKTYPYDDTMRRIRKALGQGELAGILWHQGESDSKPERAGVYARKLEALVSRLRTELQAPDVPFVAGTLGDFYVNRNPSAKLVNEQLLEASKRVPNLYVVSAAGLGHKGDTTHFDTPAARALGKRYAEVFITHKLLPPAR